MNPKGFWLLISALLPHQEGTGVDLAEIEDPEVGREAIQIARANGLYYPFARKLLESGLRLPPGGDDAWAAEQEQQASYLRTLRLLDEVCADGDLDYVVIKECPTIEHVPRDIDVFVRGGDRSDFLRLLTDRGLTLEYASSAETSLRGTGLFRIDVYSEIRYLGMEFVAEDFLRRSRCILASHGTPHPGLLPEAAHLVNLVHAFLGRGSLSLLDFLDFRGLERVMTHPEAPKAEAEARGWGRVHDLLIADLNRLRRGVFDEHRAIPFPHRYRRDFVLSCVSELDAHLRTREALALRASLLWDDVMFRMEDLGIVDRLRRSTVAVRVGNSLGHGLRLMRGDRKVRPDWGVGR